MNRKFNDSPQKLQHLQFEKVRNTFSRFSIHYPKPSLFQLKTSSADDSSIDANYSPMNTSISSSTASYLRTLKKWNIDGLDIEMLTTDTEDFTDNHEMSLPTFPKVHQNTKNTDMSTASYDDIEHDLNALAEKNKNIEKMLMENCMDFVRSSSTPTNFTKEEKMSNDGEDTTQNEDSDIDEIQGAAGLWAQNESLQRSKQKLELNYTESFESTNNPTNSAGSITQKNPFLHSTSEPQPSTSGIQNRNKNTSSSNEVPIRTVFLPTTFIVPQPIESTPQLIQKSISERKNIPATIVKPISANKTEQIVVKQESNVCKTVDEIMMESEEPLVYSKEDSYCNMCRRFLQKGQGIVLKDCLHIFCRRCLNHALENNEEATMRCPNINLKCEFEVRDDEIKAILTPSAYESFVKNSLMKLNLFDLAELHESYEYVETKKGFKCNICFEEIPPGNGITLKNCIHDYCKVCFTTYINKADSCVIKCPYRNEKNERCVGEVLDSELRSFASAETYQRILNRSLLESEADPNSYHCKTPNCKYWVILEDKFVEEFDCLMCKRRNCVKCKTVHQSMNCYDYQASLRNNIDYVRTERQVQQELADKRIQPCPNCKIGVQRIEGCPNMTCTRCGYHFLWR
jgi:hypothetical protein